MDLRESPAHLLVTSESFHKGLTLYAFVFLYKKSENKSFQSENSTHSCPLALSVACQCDVPL